MSSIKTLNRPVEVEVLAEYPLFSDCPADQWMRPLVNSVIEGSDDLASVSVLYTTPGTWGLQHIYFVANFFIPATENDVEAAKKCRKVLNKFVGDTDVTVLRVTPVN